MWLWSSVGFDYRSSTGLGKQKLLEVTNKTLGTLGPRKKKQWSHKRLSQTCLWVFGSLWQRCGSTAACFGVGDNDCLSPVRTSISPFRGGCHYPYHSLASSQTIGREHKPIHQQKNGLKIYWAWPCPTEQDPVFPTASLSQASYPHPSESRKNENHSHRKRTKLITWITALSNSIKLWAMPCRTTEDGSWWKILTKFTGEGNDKPLQHSCLENPMNSMKKWKVVAEW